MNSFIIVQTIGIVAWLFLLISYYRKNTHNILGFQIIGNILFCLHYFLLNAYSGLFICACDMIFNTGFYKLKNSKLIYLCSVPIRIFGGLLCYKSLIDILPIIASLIEGYSFTKEKKFVVLIAIIVYVIWLIYDSSIFSLSGLITDCIIIISNIYILIFDCKFFSKKKIKGASGN